MSAVLFIACDVGYGDEGKLGKKKKKKKGRVEFGTAACSWEELVVSRGKDCAR